VPLQLPWLAPEETKLPPAGSGSVTVTLVAPAGPAFVAVIVDVRLPRAGPGSGGPASDMRMPPALPPESAPLLSTLAAAAALDYRAEVARGDRADRVQLSARDAGRHGNGDDRPAHPVPMLDQRVGRVARRDTAHSPDARRREHSDTEEESCVRIADRRRGHDA